MIDISVFINLILNGILIGSLYALGALGLTLVFGIMGIVNVAQMDIMILSSYVLYWMFTLYGFNPFLGVVITVPLTFALGLILERVVVEPLFKRTRSRAEFTNMSLPLFLGISMVVRHSMTEIWGGDYRAITTWLTGRYLEFGLIRLPILRTLCLVFAACTVIILYMYLSFTKTGKQIRALSQNIIAAKLTGIKIERIRSISFAIGVSIAGIAGAAFSLIFIFFPAAGAEWVPLMFTIMVTGGLGCVEGTLVTGVLFGIVDSVIGYYYSLTLSRVLVFLVMLLVLLFRPAGIFGRGMK